MPIPKPEKNEDRQKFVSRCMGNETMKKDYPDNKQRIAVCLGQTKKTKAGLFDQVLEILGFITNLDCETCGETEELTFSNIVLPKDEDYIEDVEEDFED
jgi:hypothetical protein